MRKPDGDEIFAIITAALIIAYIAYTFFFMPDLGYGAQLAWSKNKKAAIKLGIFPKPIAAFFMEREIARR